MTYEWFQVEVRAAKFMDGHPSNYIVNQNLVAVRGLEPRFDLPLVAVERQQSRCQSLLGPQECGQVKKTVLL